MVSLEVMKTTIPLPVSPASTDPGICHLFEFKIIPGKFEWQPVILGLVRQRQECYCKFKTSLGNMTSSGSVTLLDPVSKRKPPKQKMTHEFGIECLPCVRPSV